jgi:hypothetical protein
MSFQIVNADRTTLYATLQTVPVECSEATGDTAITLAEPENGQPVLVKWFYPGRLTGHEFVYPKQQEQQMSQAKQETFVGNQSTSTTEAGE